MVEMLKKKREELKEAIQRFQDAIKNYEKKLEVVDELIEEEEAKTAVHIEVVSKDDVAAEDAVVAEDVADEKEEEPPHYAGMSRVVIKP